MREWLLKYWLGVLFGALTGVMGWAVRRVKKRQQAQETEQSAIKAGMLALLHSEICRCFAECDRKGFADVHDRENMEYLYGPYHALGGNGTGTDLHDKIRDMPTEPSRKVTA